MAWKQEQEKRLWKLGDRFSRCGMHVGNLGNALGSLMQALDKEIEQCSKKRKAGEYVGALKDLNLQPELKKLYDEAWRMSSTLNKIRDKFYAKEEALLKSAD